ncbi:MAG: hypothetical protein ABW033_06100 [Acidimicrobiia bacterium]
MRIAVTVAAIGVAVLSAAGVAAAQTSPSLQGNAVPTLDDSGGKVAVVASSAPVDGRVAFIVENGTGHPVRIRSVASGATSVGGARALRASTTDVVPHRLAPGETAIGQVRWRSGTLEADATITWNVEARRTAARTDPGRLDASGFVLSPPLAGRVAQTLTFDVANPHDAPRFGPLQTRVLCLNEASRPVLLVARSEQQGRLRAGASTPVTVDMLELCPSYLVAVASRVDR